MLLPITILLAVTLHEEIIALETVIATKQKAHVVLLPNNTVRKKYVVADGARRVAQDRRCLTRIRERFGVVESNGWTYDFVEILESQLDPPYVDMEFLSGSSIPDLPTEAIREAERHCGIWLGHYHRRFLEQGEGLIYTDCGAGNFVIDFENKRVTGIDPGMRWGDLGHAYEDVLLHINTIIMSLMMKHKKAGFRDAWSFLEGYLSVADTGVCFGAGAYYRSFFRATAYNLRTLRKRALWKVMSSAVLLTVLAPLYLVLIPIALRRGVAQTDECVAV